MADRTFELPSDIINNAESDAIIVIFQNVLFIIYFSCIVEIISRKVLNSKYVIRDGRIL